METFKTILLFIHVPAGFISLVLFWIPVFTNKGGNTHKFAGRWYMYTMWTVVLSAALLSISNVIVGNYVMAAFLGYLTIITAYPLWYAWEIFNHKKGISQRYYDLRRYWNIGLFGASVFLIAFAAFLKFKDEGMLMLFFGLLSLPAGLEVKKSKTKIGEVMPIVEHIRGTLISGIAAYTAFFAFGGRQFLSHVFIGQLMIIPWITPTIIGLAIIQIMKRKYRKKA